MVHGSKNSVHTLRRQLENQKPPEVIGWVVVSHVDHPNDMKLIRLRSTQNPDADPFFFFRLSSRLLAPPVRPSSGVAGVRRGTRLAGPPGSRRSASPSAAETTPADQRDPARRTARRMAIPSNGSSHGRRSMSRYERPPGRLVSTAGGGPRGCGSWGGGRLHDFCLKTSRFDAKGEQKAGSWDEVPDLK